MTLGREALVERLVTQRAPVAGFEVERIVAEDPRALRELPEQERRKAQNEIRARDRRQSLDSMRRWFERMSTSPDPLQEKMVLFWHGFLTSSVDEVKRGWMCLQQNQLFRRHALGSDRDLMNAIIEDPAMLVPSTTR